ncbi:tumor necrosis factor receptor superfamily member 9 [Phyllobates terribilis]|uniref:tumor necrosis factor receptor superfamily member 9 n=1 Tax=Phyllobates terribilis TaxID=111132 RepID=UPI003CCB43A8
MDRLTWSLLSGVFQILYIHIVHGNNCYHFTGSCCSHCNPGFYLTQKCGTCVQCPKGGYADKPSDSPNCKLCNRCEGPFTYKSMCTSTRDAVCTCTAGKRCKDEKCTQCTKAKCPAGQESVGESCRNCPQGTFNDGKVLKCTPWKNCSAVGGEIISRGNLTSDVVCGAYYTKVTQLSSSSSATTTSITTKMEKAQRPPPEESNLQIIYIAVSSSLGLLLIVICVACRQKLMEKIKHACQKIPKPVVKQAEEEDGCSYHYPEEENGGENEPMTLEA